MYNLCLFCDLGQEACTSYKTDIKRENITLNNIEIKYNRFTNELSRLLGSKHVEIDTNTFQYESCENKFVYIIERCRVQLSIN